MNYHRLEGEDQWRETCHEGDGFQPQVDLPTILYTIPIETLNTTWTFQPALFIQVLILWFVPKN
jgi:hypothetical protein